VGGSLQCFENDLPFFSFGNFAKEAQGPCSAAPLAPLALSLLFSPANRSRFSRTDRPPL
jgi:hypothetical protein